MKEIKAYKTSDGKVFESAVAAFKYESTMRIHLELFVILSEETTLDDGQASEVAQIIAKHSDEFIKILTNGQDI